MTVRARHVFRWDLDKTYLRTEFDTIADLFRSAFESATDKQAYPGAAALLRLLRQSPAHRICIVSGSPKQMRKVLSAKLALDGVEYDEFVLKNNLRNLARLRFRALRSQVPYKLPVLLESRSRILGNPAETLFGDDAEADAIIYSLYADILADRVPRTELSRILEAARAYPDQIARTIALADRVRGRDAVERILIHLDRRSPTARFAAFGKRMVPIYNYFQAALVLFADGLLSGNQVLFVARDMLGTQEYELSTLANSLQDLLRRGRLETADAERLSLELHEIATGAGDDGVKSQIDGIAWAFAERVKQLGDAAPLEWPEDHPTLDYLALVDQEYQRHRSDYA